MATEEIKGGWEYNLYYKDTAWKEVKMAQDIVINDSPEMLETPMRGDAVKRSMPGQIDGEITFDLTWIEGAPDVDFIVAAEISKTAVEFAWTFDDIATNGTVYRRDWFYIRIQKNAAMGTPTLSVTLTPAIKFTSNVQVARSTETVSA